MEKYDLSDFTFIIPIRIDSPVRKENLDIVLSYLLEHFITNIMVLEADSHEKVTVPSSVEKIFIKDKNPVFHHSRYRNYMIKRTTTKFIALWDADAIAPESQVIEAGKMLMEDKCDFVFPYDGRYCQTPSYYKKRYLRNMDANVLIESINYVPFIHGLHSVGGAIMMNKKAYMDAGMENEKFYGWSPEDYERVLRCEILGYEILRIDGPLFHLEHPRGKTSSFISDEINIKSRKEILRICKMSPKELECYVKSSEWLANSEY